MEAQTAVRQETLPRNCPLTVGSKSRCHVLVAEDDIHTQQLLARLLRNANVEVTLVDNGLACVDLALEAWRNDEPFDGILLDIQMPYLRGYDVVTSLREEGYTGLIIAMTGHAYLKDNKRTLTCGCDALLTKPFSVGRFLSLLKTRIQTKMSAGTTTVEPPNETAEISADDYLDVVTRFLDRLPTNIDAIKDAFDEKDWEELRILVHRLIGAELMGYPILGDLARKIEDALVSDEREDVPRLLTQLDETSRFVLADTPLLKKRLKSKS